MAVTAKIKFRGDMPWHLESMLINKLGFRVFSRYNRDWIILEKVKSTFKPEVLINGELPEDVQTMLIKRCNTIVNQFDEPELHLDTLRTRLHNMSQTLPVLQSKYVKEWAERNLKENQ